MTVLSALCLLMLMVARATADGENFLRKEENAAAATVVLDKIWQAAEAAEHEKQRPTHWKSQTFDFEPGRRHSLRITLPYDANFAGDVDYSLPPQPAFSNLCDASSKSLSGYMDVAGSIYDTNGADKHLFFWMFEKRNMPPGQAVGEIPFLIWLTGGPGCSSTLALLAENGPCKVTPDGTSTTVNPYSWSEAAHVLWLDQPAGVGYSYGRENDSNEAMISEDAYFFLQAFFKTYPQFLSSPLYITGESYGGHYVPAIAHRIWQGNTQAKTNSSLLELKLTGITIGNGLTDPQVQYASYPEMMFDNCHGIKVIDEKEYKNLQSLVPGCTTLVHTCNQGNNHLHQFACKSASTFCDTALFGPYQKTGLNPYDMRLMCQVPGLCYNFTNLSTWLNLNSTKQALGVDTAEVTTWVSCSNTVYKKFTVDFMKDFSGYVATLLDNNIPALIYAGDLDFICNYIGNRGWTLELDWTGKAEFAVAPEVQWGNLGLVRTAQGFTFFQVFNAGHMVPMDQPAHALDMIKKFLAKHKLP